MFYPLNYENRSDPQKGRSEKCICGMILPRDKIVPNSEGDVKVQHALSDQTWEQVSEQALEQVSDQKGRSRSSVP